MLREGRVGCVDTVVAFRLPSLQHTMHAYIQTHTMVRGGPCIFESVGEGGLEAVIAQHFNTT